jgi:tRNA(Arg) A34 adenosine deaminase TadA
MSSELDYHSMLAVALAEARLGLKEGGIPIGAAIFDQTGQLIGAGHYRRVQQGDPSVHGETDAFYAILVRNLPRVGPRFWPVTGSYDGSSRMITCLMDAG